MGARNKTCRREFGKICEGIWFDSEKYTLRNRKSFTRTELASERIPESKEIARPW